MTPTVADIVALPVLQRGSPEILCAKGFDRPVRWVHVSDVADLSDLLQGDELVLTRGGALRRSPRRYLRSLAKAHAVGVVAEVGADSPPLPMSVSAIAEELDLALVILRRQIKFVEVTEEVHRAIVSEQYAEVEFSRRTHEIFTGLSTRRAPTAEIAEAAALLLDAPIVLEDLGHQALAVAAAGRRATEFLSDWDRRSRLHAAGGNPDGPDRPWAVIPVGRGSEHWARLIAIGSPADPGRTSMVLDRAAQALVIHRMAERGRSDMEHQAQAGLVDDVLQHRIRTEEEVAARAFALGLGVASRYVPATVRAREWISDGDPVAAQRRNTDLLDLVARAVKAHGHSGLFSVRDAGEVGMVLALNPARSSKVQAEQAALDALADAVHRDGLRAGGAPALVLGVAGASQGLLDAILRISESAHIAEVAAGMPASDRTVYRVSDIRLRGLLALLRDDPRVQRFAESELRALILHDIESGDNCVDILRGYLELAHHKSALAEHFHLSRPALYAKLARIERILGVELADGESATSLHVALLFLDRRSPVGARAPVGTRDGG
jgi:PucR family transcriptional regulator, purine catabolism regulatory protein